MIRFMFGSMLKTGTCGWQRRVERSKMHAVGGVIAVCSISSRLTGAELTAAAIRVDSHRRS